MLDKVLAIYMRLSISDDEQIDESNSIKAQRDQIYQFISGIEEFKDFEIEEFCDDGYSGTNFERPIWLIFSRCVPPHSSIL